MTILPSWSERQLCFLIRETFCMLQNFLSLI
ncbi:MAG TPA: hypothetical protein [Caudoviricetes sp.]|nr:MAG TPA: hypothetical protein [Caudoviricetes sp.]DAY91899.1 MAG TPA: hypothetical protein [Caudoviricetes sp.]